ncbi:MAG: 50S ribosomal protein L24e [Candidatus Bathyarchaeia archaeon]
MPRSFKCSFCGRSYPQGTGIMYVRNDGTLLRFCSSKCKRNVLELRRDSRKLKWTRYHGKKEKGA